MADNSIQPDHYNFYFQNFKTNITIEQKRYFITLIQMLDNERFKILKKKEKNK